MRTRVGVALVALLAVLLVTACGGGSKETSSTGGGRGSVPESADYTPSSSPGFVFVSTDPDGAPWKAADGLLDKFPGRDQFIAMIEQSLAKQKLSFEEDIKPALGAETGVGILSVQGDTGNTVAITKPESAAKFTALLDKLNAGDASAKKAISKQVGDWTLASDSQTALDRAAAAHDGTSLSANAHFSEAIAELPSDALVKLWLDGATLTGLAGTRSGGTGQLAGFGKLVSLAAAFQPQSDGAALELVTKTDREITAVTEYSSELVSQVPAGVLAYLSFKGLDQAIEAIAEIPAIKAQLGELQSQLGVSLAELAPLFGGEGAIYVRQGVPLPEITVALQQSDELAARRTADKLFTRIAPSLNGQITTTTIEGVSVKQLKGEQFSLYYAVFDGKLVLSDSTTAISGLKDSGDKLADDSVFKNARDAAGMPDSTAGFLYVNLKDTVPLIENFITSSGGNIAPDVQQNLEPLNSLLFYSTVDGPKATVAGFIGIE